MHLGGVGLCRGHQQHILHTQHVRDGSPHTTGISHIGSTQRSHMFVHPGSTFLVAFETHQRKLRFHHSRSDGGHFHPMGQKVHPHSQSERIHSCALVAQ